MEATVSYELKSKLAPRAIPKLTRAKVDAAARAILPYPGGFSGRGITVCAGGFRYFTNAWVLIRMLRKHGCQLPVQFWYYGEAEMDEKMRRMVEPYGVECVDARRVAKAVGCRMSQGWPLKPFSILHSRFEEVLALDADNFPIRDPEYLFDSDGYRETGAIFWPDVGRTVPTSAIWDLMGVPFRNEPEFESGQIVVNKAVCWEPLNLAMWMNEEGRADFFYKIVWGDKDTFRFAWHKFGFPFAMTPVSLQMLSVVGGPCCAGVMCQHDLDGERIFQHRNLLKWQLFGENPWVPGFLFEGESREFLAELRSVWNGRVGMNGHAKTARAAKWSRKLQEGVWLLETTETVEKKAVPPAPPPVVLAIPAEPVPDGQTIAKKDPWPEPKQRKWREIRFLKDGHCGRWSDSRFTFWDVRETNGEIQLAVGGKDGAEKQTAKLKLQADGSWRGVSVAEKAKAKLRLVAVEKAYPSVKANSASPHHANGNSSRQKPGGKTLHVFNSARGIGDHITALYACVGAANAGFEVIFHTRFPQWLERVRHPGLTITGDLPWKFSSAIDVNHDASFQQRFGRDRARWYADAIQPEILPARPANVDDEIHIPRFDFDRYVVLAPFSAWARRDWPAANWTRLTHLLRQAGYEVVAIGITADTPRFTATFGETTALWAIDHPAEWVMDAMLGAACVIGNDSGMSHLAGLLRVPTVAIHAHLPAEFLFAHAKITSVIPKTNCTLCRWQPDRGYNTACDTACSALGTIGPEEVLAKVERLAARPRKIRVAESTGRISVQEPEPVREPAIEPPPPAAPSTPVPVKYLHGIFVVNRPDLLERAVQSVEDLWPFAVILDNSPGGHIGTDRKWPIPVVRPSVPLNTAQGMNFMYRMAREKGADAFGYQHNDAEAGKGSAKKYLTVLTDAFSSGRKWAAVFTHYDLIAGYSVRAVDEIGEWDTHFPQPTYHFDVDWFHRARLCGYELIESGVPVTHHNDASNTIKSDAHWKRLNTLKFPMNETYYLSKWGGPTHGEVFSAPWNQSHSAKR